MEEILFFVKISFPPYQGDGTGHQVPRGRESSWVYKLWSQTIQDGLQDELKKKESNNAPQEAVGASKAASDKSKMPKKVEGDKTPQATVDATKVALNEAWNSRNKSQEGADVLSTQIFQLYGKFFTD